MPKSRWANWDSIVSPPRGTTPDSLVITKTPANMLISSPIIQLSVVRAFRHSTGLNAGTALEMASIPVMAVAPEEKGSEEDEKHSNTLNGAEVG